MIFPFVLVINANLPLHPPSPKSGSLAGEATGIVCFRRRQVNFAWRSLLLDTSNMRENSNDLMESLIKFQCLQSVAKIVYLIIPSCYILKLKRLNFFFLVKNLIIQRVEWLENYWSQLVLQILFKMYLKCCVCNI